MTSIHITKTANMYEITIDGHNESLICAGISTLTAALGGYVENFDKEYIYTEGDGVCRIKASKSSKEAVMMFLIGVLRIECTYPDKVKVISNV